MSDANQTIGTNRGNMQSSMSAVNVNYKSKTGSRTETALPEFAIMFYTSLTQQTARGTTMSNLPITKLDYKSLMGSRTETALTEFNIAFLNAPVTARGTVTATDYVFKKSIQMVEG
jgi:hypothetical protein